MISQALKRDEHTHPGFSPNTRSRASVSRPAESPSGLNGANVTALRRVDIFDAVWRGSMQAMLAPRIDIASGQITSVELVNCYRHPELGTVTSARLLPCLNTEQARTLFLCDLAFVQEKLRIGSDETRELLVDIPTNAAALSTLGSEVRIISQHTPDLFRRLVLTVDEGAVAALSQEQIDQMLELTGFGLSFNLRSSGQAMGGQANIPYQAVRIDASIVRGIANSPEQLAVLRSIIEHAARKGAGVVAEGLDQTADLLVVKRERCDEAQGDVIGRPAAIDDLKLQLARRPSRFPTIERSLQAGSQNHGRF